MEFASAFTTDIGRRRSQNQDNGAAHPEMGLFIVADGMGGHRGGETASAMAVETITRVVGEKLKTKKPDAREILVEAIETANYRIHQTAAKDTTLQGMGTTTTALLFSPDKLTIGHVGDSRCYKLQPGAIWQLTRDHSLVQEKLRAGLISREQLKTDRLKNVITRSVGFESHVTVETYEMDIKPGDLFMVCSDGLSGLVDDAQMIQATEDRIFKQGDLEGAAQLLVDMANETGGDDNITVVLIQVK
jgi:serine/threonine protein phosphatase PrpC